jgi:hypothetical protein
MTTIDRALMYIARGWPILVCHPRSKEPLGELVPNGVKDATTDMDVIDRWLRRHPDANLAVACGAPGPQVLDIDDPRAVPAAVAAAVVKAPRTRSARGGAAFFEGTDAGTINLGWGELRGQGSYQLIPPSIHPVGKPYTWLQEPHGKLPTAPVLLDRHGQRAGHGEHQPPPRPIVAGEGRHPYMKDYAVRIVRSGITDQDRIAAHLEREFELSCEPNPPPSQGREYFKALAKWAAKSRIAGREREKAAADAGSESPTERLRILDVDRMLVTAPPPVPWVVEPILARGCVTMLAGREGRGKSMLALAIAAAIGRATETLGIAGMSVGISGHVLYIDAENGENEAHRRVHGLSVARGTLTYVEADGFDLKYHLAELEALISKAEPKLLVLDSLRSLAPGLDENDSQEVEMVLRPIVRLTQKLKIATMLLHHASRQSGEYRGSTAIGAAVELGFSLGRHDDDPMITRRKLSCWKSRPATEPEPRWLTIKPTDGGDIMLSEAAAYEPAPATPVLDALVEELREVVQGGGSSGTDPIGGVPPVPPPWTTADFGRVVGRDHHDKTLRRAVQRLETTGLIHRNGDGLWYSGEGGGE